MRLPILLVALLLCVYSTKAEILYTENPDGLTATITGWTSPDEYIAIPEVIGFNNLVVTDIGEAAFAFKSVLLYVSIPHTVTNIGNSAFFSCTSLGIVRGMSGVKRIGEFAFSGCTALYDIFLPDEVTELETEVFSECPFLPGTIFQPNSKLEIIGDRVFYNSIMAVSPDYVSSQPATRVIVIPRKVHTIGEYAFFGSAVITDLRTSTNITQIHPTAFSGMLGLSTLYLDSNAVGLELQGVPNLQYVKLGTSVTVIPNGIFAYAPKLRYVDARTSVATNIGTYAFKDAYSLTNISLPSTLKSIDVGAFYSCTNLTDLLIPVGVTNIGTEAFYACRRLQSFNFPSNLVSLGLNVFTGATNLTAATLSTTNFSFIGSMPRLTNLTINVQYAFSPSYVSALTNVTHLVLSDVVTNISANLLGLFSNAVYLYVGQRINNLNSDILSNGLYKVTTINVSIGNPHYNVFDSNVIVDESNKNIIRVSPGRQTSLVLSSPITNIYAGAFRDVGSSIVVTIPPNVVGLDTMSFDGFLGTLSVNPGHPFLTLCDTRFFDIRRPIGTGAWSY